MNKVTNLILCFLLPFWIILQLFEKINIFDDWFLQVFLKMLCYHLTSIPKIMCCNFILNFKIQWLKFPLGQMKCSYSFIQFIKFNQFLWCSNNIFITRDFFKYNTFIYWYSSLPINYRISIRDMSLNRSQKSNLLVLLMVISPSQS